jgi:vancomycin resistance protein VanJ
VSPPSLAAAAWLLGATVLAGLALRPAVGDALLLPRYVGYVMPWLLLALVPGAAWALHARRVALAALLGVCAATIVAEHAEMLRPRPRPVIAPGFGLDVLSWNTWSRNHDAARIAGVIRARAPDLVLLQEIPWPVFEEVRAALGVGAYMHAEYALGLDQGVLSRFPLEPRAVMADKGQAQEVVVRTPAGAITVFNVHPLRTGGWRVRHDQVVRLLEEDVRSERGRVMVAGDLNVNERTQLYRRLRERMVNAHDAAGRGFGFTYPAGLEVPGIGAMPAFPAVRIDHVFVSPDLVVVEAGTLEDAGGSDHRPVYARVAVGAGGESPGR